MRINSRAVDRTTQFAPYFTQVRLEGNRTKSMDIFCNWIVMSVLTLQVTHLQGFCCLHHSQHKTLPKKPAYNFNTPRPVSFPHDMSKFFGFVGYNKNYDIDYHSLFDGFESVDAAGSHLTVAGGPDINGIDISDVKLLEASPAGKRKHYFRTNTGKSKWKISSGKPTKFNALYFPKEREDPHTFPLEIENVVLPSGSLNFNKKQPRFDYMNVKAKYFDF